MEPRGRARRLSALLTGLKAGSSDCNAESLTKESHLSEEISISDANGKCIHGNYEIANGVVTVTTAKGLSRTADVDENMLSPETLARMLLLQLHKREDPDQ